MRSLTRALTVGALAALATPLLSTPAFAGSATEPAGTGAYFWRDKLPSEFAAGGTKLPNGAAGQDTNNDAVAQDHLAVAVTRAGESNKESFLLWELLEVPPGATITKFVVKSPVSPQGPSQDPAKNTYQTDPAAAKIKACASTEGFGETDAGSYDLKPKVDDTKCVDAKFDPATKTFTYDITSIARNWADENNGIALVPADLMRPFQVVFQPTANHIASIAWTGGTPLSAGSSGFGGGSAGSTTGSLGSTGGSIGGGGGSFDAGGGSGDLGGGGSSGGDAGAATLSADGALPGGAAPPAAGPQVAADAQAAGATGATRPVAARSVSMAPPLAFWLVALVLGAVLFAMSVVTGNPVAAAVGASRRQGSVLRKVQRDARAAGRMLGR